MASRFPFILDIIACLCADENYPVEMKETDSVGKRRKFKRDRTSIQSLLCNRRECLLCG